MEATITPALATKAFSIVFGEMQSRDVYAVLAQLTQDDLAARFRSRAMELHPDRAGIIGKTPDYLERAFKQLHGAYRVLSRAIEDGTLVAQPQSSSRPARAAERPPRTQRGRPGAETDSRGSDGRGRFYAGRVPHGELRFAQFLYYNRVIDWRTMIDAITWQYRVRPKVGEIGRAYRFLDFDSVTRVLRTSPRGELFGSTAMKMGILDKRQLSVMLGKQYQLNYPIGRYFVENGILSRPEVDHLLQQNRRHNIRARNQ
jgi:hypothetical protein